MLGGFFTYRVARMLTRGNLCRAVAAGAVFFSTAPHAFTDIPHGRFAFPEIVSFMLLPVVFYYSMRRFVSRRVGPISACGVSWSALIRRIMSPFFTRRSILGFSLWKLVSKLQRRRSFAAFASGRRCAWLDPDRLVDCAAARIRAGSFVTACTRTFMKAAGLQRLEHCWPPRWRYRCICRRSQHWQPGAFWTAGGLADSGRCWIVTMGRAYAGPASRPPGHHDGADALVFNLAFFNGMDAVQLLAKFA